MSDDITLEGQSDDEGEPGERFVDAGDGLRAISSEAVVPCHSCAHWIVGTVRCLAFPERIPNEILDGKNEHLAPYAGDHGIQYEAK